MLTHGLVVHWHWHWHWHSFTWHAVIARPRATRDCHRHRRRRHPHHPRPTTDNRDVFKFLIRWRTTFRRCQLNTTFKLPQLFRFDKGKCSVVFPFQLLKGWLPRWPELYQIIESLPSEPRCEEIIYQSCLFGHNYKYII